MRQRTSRIALAIAGVLAFAGTVGCSSGDTTPSQPTTTTAGGELHADRTKDWTRAEIRDKAAAVVRVRATSSREDRVWAEDLNPDTAIPATVTTVAVIDTYKGEAPSTLPIKQIGTSKATSEDFSPLLEVDKEYLLWVFPRSMWPGEAGEQTWAIAGGQGIYRLAVSADAVPRYVYAGPGTAPLGQELATADVESGAFLR
ncbi:hypothetical protein ACIBF5_22935 [Micromonospora sp. NPDC050417]|uniref:hypothetical protein n=1 Tax=Micromonospora sp. NPDC050417 TaxID=3364280 RepID=UPI0037889392